jgi:multicomponent K+:H+ antiporter subunit C
MISMEFLLATGIGFTVACGLVLLLRGRSFSVVLGLTLLGYAVNVFIFAMGRLWSAAPPIVGTSPGGAGPYADPLPQALVLTAIVIGFATTGFVIELALRSRHENGSDHVDGRPGHDAPDAGATAGATTGATTGVTAGEVDGQRTGGGHR